MVHCVSESCRKEIEETWSFCPFCGTDNRPPEERPTIGACAHQFIPPNKFCLRCGRSVDQINKKMGPKRKKGYMYNDYEGIDTWEGPSNYSSGAFWLTDLLSVGCSGCLWGTLAITSCCFGLVFLGLHWR